MAYNLKENNLCFREIFDLPKLTYVNENAISHLKSLRKL